MQWFIKILVLKLSFLHRYIIFFKVSLCTKIIFHVSQILFINLISIIDKISFGLKGPNFFKFLILFIYTFIRTYIHAYIYDCIHGNFCININFAIYAQCLSFWIYIYNEFVIHISVCFSKLLLSLAFIKEVRHIHHQAIMHLNTLMLIFQKLKSFIIAYHIMQIHLTFEKNSF